MNRYSRNMDRLKVHSKDKSFLYDFILPFVKCVVYIFAALVFILLMGNVPYITLSSIFIMACLYILYDKIIK